MLRCCHRCHHKSCTENFHVPNTNDIFWACSLRPDYLDESAAECCIQSQSRSLIMNTTDEEHWQLSGAWLSRWAALYVHTNHRQPVVPLRGPRILLHPVLSEQTLTRHYCIKSARGLGTQAVFLSLTASHYQCHADLRCSNLPQLQESWGELVSDESAGVGVTLL